MLTVRFGSRTKLSQIESKVINIIEATLACPNGIPYANAITRPKSAMAGFITKNAPIAVAVPLPPRNFVHTGKQCPTTEANPHAYIPICPAFPTKATIGLKLK